MAQEEQQREEFLIRDKDTGQLRPYYVAAENINLGDDEEYQGLPDVLDEMQQQIEDAGSGNGTVMGVKMNDGEPIEPDEETGVIDLGTVITSHQSLAALFGKVAYDGTTHRINFYGKDDVSMTTVLGYIDCSPFIVDGMLSGVEVKNVTISGTSTLCMVFSFNTDAGKQDINIPVSAIFNAANYYTKTDADGRFQLKLVSGTDIKTINNTSILGEGNISIPAGDDGKSAYELAVEDGYEGTEEQWLASLKGAKGDKGDTVVVGGEEEFSIVNDTTTGGASDAFSAEMGKRVAGREATDRARIDAIVAILKKSVFTDDQSAAIAALDALANATDSISIDKTSYLFNGVGGTLTLTAYTDPASKPVSWSSTDSSVATVSDGVVTAIAVGTATITATSGDKSVTCAIQVQAFQVDSVTLNQSTLTSSGEVVGATHQLTATTSPVGGSIVWSSSNDSVATVDQTGLVTIVGNGTCTITATSGVESDSCAVSVSGVVHQYHINVGTLSNVSIEDGNGNAITDGQVITEGSTLTLVLVPASSHEITTASVTMGNVAQTLTDGTGGTKTVTLTVAGDISVSASATYVRTNLMAQSNVIQESDKHIGNKWNYQTGTGLGCRSVLVPVALNKRYILVGVKGLRIGFALLKTSNDASNEGYALFDGSNDMPSSDLAAFQSCNNKLDNSNKTVQNNSSSGSQIIFTRNSIDFKTPPSVNEGIGQLYLFICTYGEAAGDRSIINSMRLYEWSILATDSFDMSNALNLESQIDVSINTSGLLSYDSRPSSNSNGSGPASVIKLTPGERYHFENYNLGGAASFAAMALCKTANGGYTFTRLANGISGYTFLPATNPNAQAAAGYTYRAYMGTNSSAGQAYSDTSGDFTAPTGQLADGEELLLIVNSAYMANGAEGAGTFTLTQITE